LRHGRVTHRFTLRCDHGHDKLAPRRGPRARKSSI